MSKGCRASGFIGSISPSPFPTEHEWVEKALLSEMNAFEGLVTKPSSAPRVQVSRLLPFRATSEKCALG